MEKAVVAALGRLGGFIGDKAPAAEAAEWEWCVYMMNIEGKYEWGV